MSIMGSRGTVSCPPAFDSLRTHLSKPDVCEVIKIGRRFIYQETENIWKWSMFILERKYKWKLFSVQTGKCVHSAVH